MPPETTGRRRDWALATLIPYLRLYRGRIAVGVAMVLLTNVAVVITPKVWDRRSMISPREPAPTSCFATPGCC